MRKTGIAFMRRVVEVAKSGTVPTLRQVAAAVDVYGINNKWNRERRQEIMGRFCHALCLIIDAR